VGDRRTVNSRFVALPQGGGNAPVGDRTVFTAIVFVVTGLRGKSVVIGRMDRGYGFPGRGPLLLRASESLLLLANAFHNALAMENAPC